MKFWNGLFNFFWVILVGLWAAICSILIGVVLCCTLILIPFGLQYFKFSKLVFAPAGKQVVLHYGSHPFMNTINVIFGGFFAFLFQWIIGAICCITIIGIPLGRQMFKVAKFNLAPFGSEIVKIEA